MPLAKPDPLKPSLTLLIKLGSIAVHTEEMMSPGGHDFDRIAINQLLADPLVQDWIKQMSAQAFLPVKRA